MEDGAEQGADRLQQRGVRKNRLPLRVDGAQAVDSGADSQVALRGEGRLRAVRKALGAVKEIAEDGALGFHLFAVGALAEEFEGRDVGGESEGVGRVGMGAAAGMVGREVAELLGHVETVVVEKHVAADVLRVEVGRDGSVH